MARKKIAAGNWKMNTTLDEAVELVRGIQSGAQNTDDVLKILFAPFPFLKTVRDLVSEDQGIHIGAQNCSQHDKGAYTGEVSARMLSSVGCSHVLVGHSERREYFSENGAMLAEKAKLAAEAGLTVVYCIGERLKEREAGLHFSVVQRQLEEVLGVAGEMLRDKLIVAYEPVWAIGTGVTASTAQAREMHAFIRKSLSGIYDVKTSEGLSILYGGSCNASNAAELFACADVDGGLIGGASLKADEFCRIVRSF